MRNRLICLGIWAILQSGCVSNITRLNDGIAHFEAKEYRQAFIVLKPAATKGDSEAQYALGYMYFYGLGVIEDRKLATEYFKFAAKSGHQDAIEVLKKINANEA